MKRITIIDDELHICESVSFAAEQEGYSSNFHTNPLEALREITESLPDLVILDIIMPELSGLEVCRRLRTFSETLPIIFLTSKDEEFDKVLGLEMGADDYLCKPFSMKELMARIKVALRRIDIIKSHTPISSKAVKTSHLTIDEETYNALYFEKPLSLTVTEFRLLYSLAKDTKMVKTRDQLLTSAFPSDYHVNDRAIDTHIKRIRRKLAAIEPNYNPIETVFGVGYRFVEE